MTLMMSSPPVFAPFHRFCIFSLPEGIVRRVSFERMTQIPHATKFIIKKEDHTFGNIIRMCASYIYSLHIFVNNVPKLE